ncbi:MBL fold metallo-hydrolase [Agriterribacter sp.]|uniref:MBL fold metallo-hydrolase n=1 Tax=Agriterribacter sp. TaxID=2821509 RepID=UPI002C8C31B9|nr:MBL fold metallo-hydrolase [Agriterribacter sp.]HRO46405.1 MBL fold metallo-hydrolase [Agriterribacter sp.]HRQ17593.1 MBL fold metallo-hydrolase [Agriterribacter sp.]
MIPAIIKDEDFIAQVQQYENDKKHFHLWWLGQSGYLLLWQGKRILLDPYLSDSLTKKYAGTAKPHTRMSERVVNPELLKNISIVSSSHNHTDHLDGETLIPIIKNNPGITFIIPEANRSFVANRAQIPQAFPAGLTEGMHLTVGDFTFYGIAAAHNTVDRNEKGECLYMGYIIQFGNYTIYHSGDTLWYAGLEKALNPFAINLALLPINGNDPARGVAGNFNVQEAAALAKAAGIQHVIPCHYDMFTFNTANPAHFAANAKAVQQAYSILPIGGHWSSEVL